MGGKKEEKTEGNVIGSVYVGGVNFTLCGTEEGDKNEVNCIRDACYYAFGGLIFIEKITLNGKDAIVVTGAICKRCGANILSRGKSKWGENLCRACR